MFVQLPSQNKTSGHRKFSYIVFQHSWSRFRKKDRRLLCRTTIEGMNGIARRMVSPKPCLQYIFSDCTPPHGRLLHSACEFLELPPKSIASLKAASG